jgi:hypothetical protein
MNMARPSICLLNASKKIMRHEIVTELEGCLILGKRSGEVHHIAILTSNSLFLLSTCESAVDDAVSAGAWVEGGSPFQDDIVLH